ncbi:FAD-binding protein [Stutzerimonas stutzeri]|uniref:FAD-binding protein n=1 Tax=Stutzerimonas stutzeri TaxID=316 RepID=W8RAK8_STUST|nr:siderophore-interacting protein [Stutzerimonas stutzeri]AHL75452.1 FAD-binding protein [Stutzerimonas stutzeri]MCQ4327981.1 siderophore-interacting protein [Stutzerimonas stutzeri]
MSSLETRHHIQRVRYELRRREVEVIRVEPLGRSFARITFRGEELADFESAGFDDHIKFIFEDGDGESVRRDYTPRAFDRDKRELMLEFALHGSGKACAWARAAKPGQKAVIGGPRGSRIVPMDYDWHLLVGDDSAMPAIARRLEELPADAHVLVIAVAKANDRPPLSSAAQVQVQWVEHADALAPAVSALVLPAGDGFAWGAGEASAMKAVRQVLVHEKQHPTSAMRVAAYWRQGSSDFHEELTE